MGSDRRFDTTKIQTALTAARAASLAIESETARVAVDAGLDLVEEWIDSLSELSPRNALETSGRLNELLNEADGRERCAIGAAWYLVLAVSGHYGRDTYVGYSLSSSADVGVQA